MQLSIISLHFITTKEQLETAKQSVESIRNQADQLILFDNGSTLPEAEEWLWGQESGSPFVFGVKENIGYTRAINLALEQAFGTHCVFVANDVILSKGKLSDLCCDDGIRFPVMKTRVEMPWWNGDCFGFPNRPFFRLDEQFYLYYSDTDLFLKTYLTGKELEQIPTVEILHEHGMTMLKDKNRMKIYNSDHQKFLEKWEIDPDKHPFDLFDGALRKAR